jgi:hypothetical protein
MNAWLESLPHLRGRAADPARPPMAELRAAAAPLFVVTGALAAIERATRPAQETRDDALHGPLTWAPLIIGPLAAASQAQRAREPDEEVERFTRALNGTAIALGGTLLLYDLLRSGSSVSRPFGPLGLVFAGLLGIAVDRAEARVAASEADLRRRATLIERLVPRRRARVDRIVVHV